ncbi:M23 family metallopeptidase, partial [Arthrospira platensis SPKY1]|nr:M23 family metallopeptidase [Arthrospira platensis SPKY1]
MNEETFEEIFSLKLNLMNVFVVLSISSIVLIGITTYVIAFTPLREYIPGYSSTSLQKKAIVLEEQTREMEKELQQNALFLESIRKVLIGDLEYAKFNKDSILAAQTEEFAKLNLFPNQADSLLRMQVAQEDKYNLFEKSKPRISLVLFSPVNGKILETFEPKNRFFGIRVQTVLNLPVKAVANGTVLFSDWTPAHGNMLMIRHNDGIISVYKGVSDRSKQQ